MDNVLVRDDGEVGLLGFEFSGSYPLWFGVGAPDWMSDEWLDDEDRRTHELEGMEPASPFELEEPIAKKWRQVASISAMLLLKVASCVCCCGQHRLSGPSCPRSCVGWPISASSEEDNPGTVYTGY